DEDGELRQLLRRAAVRDLGYELVPGWLGYYKIHTDAKRWHDAHEVCAQEGAHLLVINSPQEADAVQNLGNEGKLAPLADYILLPRLGFYKVHTEVQTWENAIATCEGEGTHLLVISTRDEEKALLPLIDKTPARGNYYWVGLHDHFSEGQYQNIRSKYRVSGIMNCKHMQTNYAVIHKIERTSIQKL
ncbi:hypothetical protein C0J52_04046, partial [Blattella germanica]